MTRAPHPPGVHITEEHLVAVRMGALHLAQRIRADNAMSSGSMMQGPRHPYTADMVIEDAKRLIAFVREAA